MGMPKGASVEAVKPFVEQLAFAGLKRLGHKSAHGSPLGTEVETLRLGAEHAAPFKRGPFGSRRNGAMHAVGGPR